MDRFLPFIFILGLSSIGLATEQFNQTVQFDDSRCSHLRNDLPHEFISFSLDELYPIAVQLKKYLEINQNHLNLSEINNYAKFDKLLECMVKENKWAPIKKKRFPWSPDPTKITKTQFQNLPPEAPHLIWWTLSNEQVSWVTGDQLNWRLSQEPLSAPHKTWLTKEQVQGINKENMQKVLDESDIYRWWKWFSDEQISWISKRHLCTLILNLRKNKI